MGSRTFIWWLLLAFCTLAVMTKAHPSAAIVASKQNEYKRDVKANRIPYGFTITSCTEPGKVALTFDDGPLDWTRTIAEKMDDAGFKATFFLVGNLQNRTINWSRQMDDEETQYPNLLRSLHRRGHQLGSHTFEHVDLDSLSHQNRSRQMLNNDQAFRNVFGFAPTYMRPPKGSCGKECLEDMKKLNYHTIWWDINPEGWKFNTDSTYNEALMRFDRDLNGGGSIAVCHDVEMYTARMLVPHMISELKKRNLKGVTVGDCLGDPAENWYRFNDT